MTRRRWLKLSLLGGMAVSGGLLLGPCLFDVRGRHYALPKEISSRLRCLSPKEYLVLQAAAGRILEGATPHIDIGLWVDAYVARLDPGIGDDVRGLLQLLEHSPLWLGLTAPFSALLPEQRDRVLRDWQGSRLALRRQGFQALKSMCCLAHYQDPRSFRTIGYSGPMLP